jgi:hypothetical protein
MKTLTLLLLLFVTCSVHSKAQTDTLSQSHYLSLEVDPAPFVLNGYSFSVKYSSKRLPHLAFTGAVYAAHFPDKMMSKTNYQKGWREVHFETSYAGFVDYFLNRRRTGLHAGPSLFLYKKSAGLEGISQRATFYTIYPNIRIGYVYQPFRKIGLYLNPWINVGSERNLDKANHLEDITFTPSSFQYIMALHIGYQLNFTKAK